MAGNVVSTKQLARLAVVLTKDQVRRVRAQMQGTSGVVLPLLYSTGMPVLEALRLRVKDLVFPDAKSSFAKEKDFATAPDRPE